MSPVKSVGFLIVAAVIGMGAIPSHAADTSGASATTTAKSHHAHMTHAAKMDSALVAEATVKPDSAKAIALAKVPGGTVQHEKISKENGKLVYTFGIKAKGGWDMVLVDAMDGSVISDTHKTMSHGKHGSMSNGASSSSSSSSSSNDASGGTSK